MYIQKDWARDPELGISQIIAQSETPTRFFDHCYTEEQDGETTYMGWNFIPAGGLGGWLDDVDLILDDLMTAGYRIHYAIEPHDEVALSEHSYPEDVIYFEFKAGAQW